MWHTHQKRLKPLEKLTKTAMADVFTPEKRSQLMSRIRSKGNISTEIAFINLLRKHKITGWRRNSKLPGKPDFVFLKTKLAIFVDGDFWHGHPKRSNPPGTNTEFWLAKIAGNRRRDRRVSRELASMGWAVLRIWESSLAKQPARTFLRVSKKIEECRTLPKS